MAKIDTPMAKGGGNALRALIFVLSGALEFSVL